VEAKLPALKQRDAVITCHELSACPKPKIDATRLIVPIVLNDVYHGFPTILPTCN
jgi:hypothetical protein